MIRLLRLLTLRRLRHDPRRVSMALVAMGAGVTLAVTTLVVTESIDRSAREFGQGIAGAAMLRVEGIAERGGLTEERLRAIERTAGVRAAVPLVRAMTFVDPPSPADEPIRAIALGIDCRVEQLTGDVGCTPELLELLRDEPLGIGPELAAAGPEATVRSEAGRIPLGDASVFRTLEGVAAGRAVLFTLPKAQEIFGRQDRFDVAYVVADEGADAAALRAALDDTLGGHHAILAADDPPAGLELFLSTFMPLFGILSLFGVAVGALLVRNIVTLALTERRQQLAIVLAIGSARSVPAITTLAEVGVLGLAGGAAGAASGAALAYPITSALSPFVESMLGIPLVTHHPPAALAAGVAMGAVVAVLAAALPVRSTLRMHPVAVLGQRDLRGDGEPPGARRRAVVWVAVAAAGVAGCWAVSLGGGLDAWQVLLGPPAFLAAAVGVLLTVGSLGPHVTRVLAVWLQHRRPSAATVLATGEFQRDARRTGVMLVTVAAAVIVAVVADGMERSIRFAVESGRSTPHGVHVFTGEVADPDVETTALLGPEVIAALEAMPQVAGVVRSVLLLVGQPGAEIALQASEDPVLAERVLRGTADGGRLASGEVLVGPGLARRLGIAPGGELELPTPDGTAAVRVQGVWEDGRYGGVNATLPLWLVEDLYGPQPAVTVTARPAPGIDEAGLARLIRGAGIDPRLNALTRSDSLSERAGQVVAQIAPIRVLQNALLLLVFVAVASTMLLAARQRRREHALLVALGARPGDLVRTFVHQAVIVAVVAVGLAAAGAPVLQWSLQQVLPLLVGFRQPFRPEMTTVAVAGTLVLVVSLAASLWPARQAPRIEVVEAMRSE